SLVLHVDGDRPLAAPGDAIDEVGPGDVVDAVDTDHLGAEVAEEHPAERARPEPAHHDHADAAERTRHRLDAQRWRAAAASSVACVITWLRFSTSMAANRSGASVFTWSARFVSCTPSGECAAMPDASSSARSSRCSSSTSSLTRPRPWASSADTVRPV